MSTITRSATLNAVGDTVSLLTGPLAAVAIAAGRKHEHQHDSVIRGERHAQFTVTASGVFTGVRYSVVRVFADQTESAGAPISPIDSTTTKTVIDFPNGSVNDFKIRLDAIASGSVAFAISSTRPGSEAGPGESAFRWPPVGPVGG